MVLGVSAYYHDSAAAIVQGQHIIAAAQEERFTRRKGDPALPKHAIDYVLKAAGVHPGELSAVAYYEDPGAKADRMLSTYLTGDIRAARAFSHAMRSWLPDKMWVEHSLRRMLGSEVPILRGDHHASHAASAYYPSPYEESAIVTIDGVGEWSTTTIGHGRGPTIDLHEHVEYPDSLGLLYSAFTLHCGFRINSGEYKLMGLAPYGKPVHAQAILDDMIDLKDDGTYSLNPSYFAYHRSLHTCSEKMEKLLGTRARAAEEQLTSAHADIAASIQVVLDQAVHLIARRAQKRTGSRNLCLAGGVALNVTSVGHLHRSGLYESIFVQPAAGDAGGALGAALRVAHVNLGAPRDARGQDGMQGAFLGPSVDDDEDLDETLKRYRLKHRRMEEEELAGRIAEAIACGKVVAVARGRMEYGPRALGARSVLADARDENMQSRLNLKTKFREGFRTFAPMVLAERAEEWFDTQGRQDPYMLSTAYVKPQHWKKVDDEPDMPPHQKVRQVRSSIPAVTHVDMSARIQTIDEQRNPFIHKTLKKFEDLTGCPVIVNTSFNVRGEPIVRTAEDAIECFLATDIDLLVLEDVLVDRSDQAEGELRPLRPAARRDD